MRLSTKAMPRRRLPSASSRLSTSRLGAAVAALVLQEAHVQALVLLAPAPPSPLLLRRRSMAQGAREKVAVLPVGVLQNHHPKQYRQRPSREPRQVDRSPGLWGRESLDLILLLVLAAAVVRRAMAGLAAVPAAAAAVVVVRLLPVEQRVAEPVELPPPRRQRPHPLPSSRRKWAKMFS